MCNLMDSIRKEIQNRNEDFAVFLAVTFGAWLFGIALFSVILHFSGEKEGWVSLGVIMGGMVTVILVLASGILQVTMVLDIAVSMGQRRRDYYWANFIVTLMEGIASLIILILLGFLEKRLFAGYIREAEEKINLLPWVIRWGVPVLVTMCAVISLVGIMLHHFGKWMSVVISCLFVAACWTPMILDKSQDAAEGSLLFWLNRAMQNFYHWLTAPRALLILAAVTAAALAAGRILVRNEAVKV